MIIQSCDSYQDGANKIEQIKNGLVYSFILFILILILTIVYEFKRGRLIKPLVITVLTLASTIYSVQYIHSTDPWRTIIIDAKPALLTDQYIQWQSSDSYVLPSNSLGREVVPTNYFRTAWAKEGIKLVLQNPLGYGLIEESFGKLARIAWPNSKLSQTHSGWLDLTLGIGIVGALIILSSMLLLIASFGRMLFFDASVNLHNRYYIALVFGALISHLLIWCTVELSQKVFFDALIFWVALACGVFIRLR
jgi:hypothetical protein